MDAQALRRQAVLLTQAVFTKMTPRPTVAAEKVAPIVYELLANEVPVAHIELALQEAKAHTRAGIDYTLRTLVPSQAGMKPKMDPVRPLQWDPPTEGEKARVRSIIGSTRASLNGCRPPRS